MSGERHSGHLHDCELCDALPYPRCSGHGGPHSHHSCDVTAPLDLEDRNGEVRCAACHDEQESSDGEAAHERELASYYGGGSAYPVRVEKMR